MVAKRRNYRSRGNCTGIGDVFDPDVDLLFGHFLIGQRLCGFRHFALDDASEWVRSIEVYLKANLLLVDCLNTDCYVSRDTRQKILDELLTVPESLTNAESS